MYSQLPEGAQVRKSGVTGYGERLVRAAFGFDLGEVETLAHARAAEAFLPGVTFVIDLGGQDMKCFAVRGGRITDVFLNEACSSGCGSFLQTFAESQSMSVLLGRDAVRAVTGETRISRCLGCGNKCLLTRTEFGNGKGYTAGNRCEKGKKDGEGETEIKEKLPNLYEQKYKQLFARHAPLTEAKLGVVGIPRVLNLYEDYPFWFTFLTALGFRVELSDPKAWRWIRSRLNPSAIPRSWFTGTWRIC